MDVAKTIEVLDDVQAIGLNVIAVCHNGQEALNLLITIAKIAKEGGTNIETINKIIEVVKNLGVGIDVVNELMALIGNLQEAVKDSIDSLPELKDLDEAEASQVATKAYQVFMTLVNACKC
jgi:hypothetical protein